MKLPIPDDTTEEWECYQISWPKSDQWRAILAGLLLNPASGRFWDERSGSIRDIQVVGREIWERNEALTGCVECPDCPDDPTPPTHCGVTCATGTPSTDESEDDMGQVVTDVTVNDDGQIVVWFGPCCSKVLDVASTTEPTPEDNTSPDPTGDGPFYACAKAYWAVRVCMQFAESIFSHCDDLLDITPWGEIKAENPGIEYSLSWAYVARAEALKISKQLGADWVDQADLEDTYRCSVLPLFSNTDENDLADDNVWASFKIIFFGGIDNFVWGAFWVNILNALGKNQIGSIALNHATEDDKDCNCPEVPSGDLPTGYDWAYEFNFKTDDQGWSLEDDTVSNSTYGLIDTPEGQYNLIHPKASRLAGDADATTYLKYAKIFYNVGVGYERTQYGELLYLDFSPAVSIVSQSQALNGAQYATGNETNKLWSSVDGVQITNGLKFGIGYDGYLQEVPVQPLAITKIVLAGDGTPPFGTP